MSFPRGLVGMLESMSSGALNLFPILLDMSFPRGLEGRLESMSSGALKLHSQRDLRHEVVLLVFFGRDKAAIFVAKRKVEEQHFREFRL